jgi:predicted Ser/Thr protein kinase
MKLLAKGRRGEVFVFEKNWQKFCLKKAIDGTKKAAIEKEILILKFLNSHKINFVPQIVEVGEGFFVYKWIEWETLKTFSKNKTISQLKDIYLKLLQYSRILDELHVEHGELLRPTKNVLVWKSVILIDFERWNLTNTKNKNLRAFAQFLFRKRIISLEDVKNLDYCNLEQKIKDLT